MPLPLLIPLAALALSAASGAYGTGSAIAAKKKAKRADDNLQHELASRPDYTTPQSVNEQLNAARAQVGATDPATMAAYSQVQQQAADARAFAQRNSSSGAQALGQSAMASQQVNSILPALAQQQREYNMASLANLNQALQGKTEDDRARYDQQLSRYSDMVNYHLGRVGAANQDKAQGIAMGAQGISGAIGFASQLGGNGGGAPRPETTDMPSLQPAGGSLTTSTAIAPAMKPVGYSTPYAQMMAYYRKQPYYRSYAN